jgi:hypothetical protein
VGQLRTRVKKQYPIALLAAFAGILIGSLFLTGGFPGSSGQINGPKPVHTPTTSMPMDAKYAFAEREKAFDAIGTHYLQVDENYVDEEVHCEDCIYAEYQPGPHKRALYAFESKEPSDLRGARFLSFIARGDVGGEVLNVYVAGKRVPLSDDMDSVAGGTELGPGNEGPLRGVEFAFEKQLLLQNDWSKYEIDLSGFDLSKVTHAFAFEIISADDKNQLVYLDFIYFDAQESEYSIPLN